MKVVGLKGSKLGFGYAHNSSSGIAGGGAVGKRRRNGGILKI